MHRILDAEQISHVFVIEFTEFKTFHFFRALVKP